MSSKTERLEERANQMDWLISEYHEENHVLRTAVNELSSKINNYLNSKAQQDKPEMHHTGGIE